jgi:hypothetical protein
MRIRLRGTESTPLKVAITVGKNTLSAIVATFEPSPNQERQQRDLRNREHRRNKWQADGARYREQADHEPDGHAEHGADEPTVANTHERRRHMPPQVARDREIPERAQHAHRRRQEDRAHEPRTGHELPQRDQADEREDADPRPLLDGEAAAAEHELALACRVGSVHGGSRLRHGLRAPDRPRSPPL